MKSAAILCEGLFGKPPGKTAAGLVRKSRKYQIVGVIDSASAGKDAGAVLDGVSRNIPIFSSMKEIIEKVGKKPDYLIIGIAPVGGKLPASFRKHLRDALGAGINVISGLHEFLSQDAELSKIAEDNGSEIIDIRKEPPLEKLRHFRNLSKDLPCVKIPVLGTDAAIGKRTTAWAVTDSLNEMGVKATFVATGQTGLLQGADFGIPLDAIKGDFVVGELEGEIVRAYETDKPKVIIIEGQGSLSHPAYVTGSRAIATASSPNGVILQHAPMRKFRTFHENELHLSMPTIEQEIEMIGHYAGCPVIAITINHSEMNKDQVSSTIVDYEKRFGVPCTDVLWFGAEKLAKTIINRFLE
ncbi:MAG: DUF1611 domain-containing protein [Thermoplasmata archaeon]|nr:DUF1611 domain-containing protein [Thermoplasmata archaeon]MDH4300433.1 DUF1611 domain-containing protein [Dehalococcoidia bacterium]